MNTKRPKDNLTNGEQKILEELSKRDDIIITNADKGGVIVIMGIDKDISKAQHQLNDKNNYKKLQTDATLQHNKLVNDRVERFKKDKSIPAKIADGLITSNPRPLKRMCNGYYLCPHLKQMSLWLTSKRNSFTH